TRWSSLVPDSRAARSRTYSEARARRGSRGVGWGMTAVSGSHARVGKRACRRTSANDATTALPALRRRALRAPSPARSGRPRAGRGHAQLELGAREPRGDAAARRAAADHAERLDARALESGLDGAAFQRRDEHGASRGAERAQEPRKGRQRAARQRPRMLEQPAERPQVAMPRQRAGRGEADRLGSADERAAKHAPRACARPEPQPASGATASGSEIANDRTVTRRRSGPDMVILFSGHAGGALM